MSNGKVEQIDTPEKIYDQPATAFVADFMGNANRLQARFADGQVWIGDLPFGNGVNAGGEGDATAFVRARSEEHTSELQSLMRISYAVFCLKKKKLYTTMHNPHENNIKKTQPT